ncbi:MAG: glutamate mutase L [Capsulimonadales bacterium]|nr:glutamate mutase L [Capsulimonadales bacterium]
MPETEVRSILATDCGSTTTKAILIERQPDGEYRLTVRGEAPTTVEAPFDDVTVGVTNAVREVEELSGKTLLSDSGKVRTPATDDRTGVDLYLSTSSAGGGLQMTVAGVVREMSTESAARAALGAGAIVIDQIAINDGRKDFEKVERLRSLRPDMILLAGGTNDGGMVPQVQEIAELLRSADPRPRLGIGLKLPVIYAGSERMTEAVLGTLADTVDLRTVSNLRPTMDFEELGPAREAIHELFLEHVMQQAPGYGKLTTWTSAGIMSTPNAVGKIMETIARERGINILGVDIGGATTDVFSVFRGIHTRTVSANLGMSYSICNVLTEAGLPNILRWLPFEETDAYIRNQLRNKMIRPTTIPQTLRDLQIEQAAAREALRLAFVHHKSLAREMVGVQQERTVGDLFEQRGTGRTLVNMMTLDMIVGSGGVLAHAPEMAQTALMLLDAYAPEGRTTLAKDSIFMMPQLGILSTLLPEAATQVFERDCLIKLGDCFAPVGVASEGEPCMTVRIGNDSVAVRFGELKRIPLGLNETVSVTVEPSPRFDIGAGKGRPQSFVAEGGTVGLMLDGRGRPLAIPTEDAVRARKMAEWLNAVGLSA